MKIKQAVIILPTYNERENIVSILEAILMQKHSIKGVRLSVLVVDDSSPDGTSDVVREFSKKNSNIYLLGGTKKQGLGSAYIRGFKHAIEELNADVVFEMDADFSHNPMDIPRLLIEVLNGSDFVIGSRYIPGGSIPNNWSFMRKANSKWGNIFARYVAGLGKVHDCTGGYRAINTNLIKKIDMGNLGAKGYAFQINLLYQALRKGAKVTEIPIHFTDRVYGKSKLRFKDITEFVFNCLILGSNNLKPLAVNLIKLIFAIIFIFLIIFISKFGFFSYKASLSIFITAFSIILTLQGLFTLVWMLYAWENPEDIDHNKSPKEFFAPKLSFTALIPARHEEKVIKDTVRAVNNINYPDNLKEVLILCRKDDKGTITKVQEIIKELEQTNIRLIIFNTFPINKPHGLNYGLKEAKNDIVTIFDAEDEPHTDIYNIINTVMIRDQVDVIQSGVQLMNYRSHWFSALNVMEYFLWFKSGLHFFLKIGNVTPLGGNTVFFKKPWLEKVGGWDENCLTEDADIGLRLISTGAKTRIIYDEQHTTQEETPTDLTGLIKQRTRWNQGFLQIFIKGDWKKLPQIKQKLVTLYILTSPVIQAFFLLYTPISVWIAFTQKVPVIVSLFSFIPLYLLVLQVLVYIVGLYEFTKAYKQKFPLWMPLKVLVTFFPYQLMLMISSFRAFYRIVYSKNSWEKTFHTNGHRNLKKLPILIGLSSNNAYAK